MTFSDLITNVELLLRQEPGISVQQYSEDIIAALLQRSFNRVFKKYWMPEFYNPGETFTLNGTTGQVTEDLTAKIKNWSDIRYIWQSPYTQPLKRRSPSVNPNSGSVNAPGWEAIAGNKMFRIVPITTTGSVVVAYRTKPDDFTSDTEITFDTAIIEAETMQDYLVDDGANELSIKKWAQILTDRENDYSQLLNGGPRPVAPGRDSGAVLVWSSP